MLEKYTEIGMKKEIKQVEESSLISRRKALKKMGYVSLSAATMMILVNTQSAKAASTMPQEPTAPADPNGDGTGQNPIWK